MVFLEKIYQKFLIYEKDRFFQDSDFWFGVEKTSEKRKKEIFNNYYKISFYRFLTNLKHLIYSENPFDFIEKGRGDDWEIEVYLSFLRKEGIAVVSGDKIIFKNNIFFDYIPKPFEKDKIKEIIEKRTKNKIKEKETVISFINQFVKFKVKGNWDQMPISQSSALFSVEKILDYISLNKKFLFIGDDDFLSVFLSLADKKIESVVIDADKELLECISIIASRFDLKIETKLADIRKKTKIKNGFVGFWCNPPYTEKGIKYFIDYGISQLDKNGGTVFLSMGTENIGNRMLFLQKYFSQKNLMLEEAVTGKISYPYLCLHKEDKDNLKKMKKHFSEDKIKKSVRLGADLWIFDYIPFRIKKIESSDSIYSYL